MVPPPKPAASQVRTSQPHSPVPRAQARPLPFKTLLMKAAPQEPKAPSAKAAEPAVRSPEPAKMSSGDRPPKPVADDDEKRPKGKPDAKPNDHDVLDPAARISAQLAPPVASSATTTVAEAVSRSRVSLEELIPQVLKRIAWGGDRTKGSVHLELVSGEKVTVHAEGRSVRVEVEGNVDLERRIGSRLRAAGIEVESVG